MIMATNPFANDALFGHSLTAMLNRWNWYTGMGVTGLAPLRGLFAEHPKDCTAVLVAPLNGTQFIYNFRGNNNDLFQWTAKCLSKDGLFVCGSSLVNQLWIGNEDGVYFEIGVTWFTGSVGPQSFIQQFKDIEAIR